MNILSIQPINVINFHGKIIDAHAHVGFHDNQLLTKNDLDVFVKSELPNKDKVEKILVSDIDVLHGKSKEYNGNKKTLKLFENDSRYALFASCNPANGNVKEIEKLFKENPNRFVGLKFHPEIQQLEPSNSKYIPYFNFANKYNIPCLFHTQVKLDNKGKLTKDIDKFSDPELIYQTAKKYPKTPFVMAHMGAGWNEAHDKAINVLINSIKNGDANIYADISWVDIDAGNKDHIIKAIKELKGIGNPDWRYGDQSFRLLFGTDAPLARFKPDKKSDALTSYTQFIEDIKLAIKKDKDLAKDADKITENLFYNNAKKLYLDKRINFPTQKNHKSTLLTAFIAAVGTLGYIACDKM